MLKLVSQDILNKPKGSPHTFNERTALNLKETSGMVKVDFNGIDGGAPLKREIEVE